MKLIDAANAWDTPGFEEALKRGVEGLDASALPLIRGMEQGSALGSGGFRATVLGAEEAGGRIVARVGIFFTSVIAGCNCADDPTVPDENNEYCELRFEIERASGEATVALI